MEELLRLQLAHLLWCGIVTQATGLVLVEVPLSPISGNSCHRYTGMAGLAWLAE